MSIRLLILLVAVIPAVTLAGRSPLPPDINPITWNDLDADGQRIFDARMMPALTRGR